MNTYSFDAFDTSKHQLFTNPSVIEKDLRTLTGILAGIQSDTIITDKEHSEVIAWIKASKPYEERQPYKEVISLLREAISDNVLTEDECKNITWFCNQYVNRTAYYNSLTAGIQQLTGILHGITIDKEINQKELEYLDNWMEENEQLKNTWPYDEIYNLTTSILRDREISKEERESFLSFAEAITGAADPSNIGVLAALSTGFYQIDPNIQIQENTFCITGLSKKYKRREIAEKIELYGGYVQEKLSSKVKYLIVCDEKNTCWAFTCYGRKIEEAMKHRKNGVNMVIVHEYDLYDHFENL